MSYENYEKIMSLLDIVENELNKVAAEGGHVSFAEFMAQKSEVFKKAA
ncbi:hypothetical protein [Vibrio cholerae]|nr:hypothetical protein [Vibrio cholerae]